MILAAQDDLRRDFEIGQFQQLIQRRMRDRDDVPGGLLGRLRFDRRLRIVRRRHPLIVRRRRPRHRGNRRFDDRLRHDIGATVALASTVVNAPADARRIDPNHNPTVLHETVPFLHPVEGDLLRRHAEVVRGRQDGPGLRLSRKEHAVHRYCLALTSSSSRSSARRLHRPGNPSSSTCCRPRSARYPAGCSSTSREPGRWGS